MHRLILRLLTAALLFSACTAPASESPAGSVENTPSGPAANLSTSSPTATIVWFPATATWTPLPSIQPSLTPLPFPGIGPQVYQDDFSDLKTWSFSSTEISGSNSIILYDKQLTLAINSPPAALFSINNSLALTDFYAETTVSVNRCFGSDTYGMLFRAASGAFTYRYMLNCSGKARVEQSREGLTLPLQDWVLSGDAPPGAPGQVKMGVWTAGSEMRFFLNGRYQFTVFDPLFKSGSLGVFANASSPGGVNISFSNLTVNSVAYVSATPTATPSKTPLPSRTPRPTP